MEPSNFRRELVSIEAPDRSAVSMERSTEELVQASVDRHEKRLGELGLAENRLLKYIEDNRTAVDSEDGASIPAMIGALLEEQPRLRKAQYLEQLSKLRKIGWVAFGSSGRLRLGEHYPQPEIDSSDALREG